MNGFRRGSRLGKYRIEKRLGEGAFATVYQAFDTLEGLRVALKVPHAEVLDAETEADFRREIRLAAKMQHPRILPLKAADCIQGRLVLAYPLGERTLEDRLKSRLGFGKALLLFEHLLEAVAAVHEHRVIHCDIKPDNLIFVDGEMFLADFGIAKVATRTLHASGSGTVGYCAPEQAMGKPSFRSDVFSAGLVGYRMITGALPEWPFDWPPDGVQRLRANAGAGLIELLRKSIQPDPKKRFASGAAMLTAFQRARPGADKRKRKRAPSASSKSTTDWREVRWRQFQREFGKLLKTRHECEHCLGPVAEEMAWCPWCSVERKRLAEITTASWACPRCHRGLKGDWCYCPWCYGAGFEIDSNRSYSDARYSARCGNRNCPDGRLMPFMRYCPWCRTKTKQRWKFTGSVPCAGCGWGVASDYWNACAWCGVAVEA